MQLICVVPFVSADNGGPVARGITTAKRSFETLKSFHAFKKKDPRILPNSERFSL